MIADAFFSFLNWLRLLFFNREMELALIGANCVGFLRGKVFLFYIPFLFFFFFFVFFFSSSSSKTQNAHGRGGSRGEKLASEIASERTRAREGRDLFS